MSECVVRNLWSDHAQSRPAKSRLDTNGPKDQPRLPNDTSLLCSAPSRLRAQSRDTKRRRRRSRAQSHSALSQGTSSPNLVPLRSSNSAKSVTSPHVRPPALPKTESSAMEDKTSRGSQPFALSLCVFA